MTFISAKIDFEKLKKLGVRGRRATEVVRGSLEASAKEWQSHYLPKHFEEQAFGRYGYTARKGQFASPSSAFFKRSYFGRKLRRMRHSIPLVYSGATRDQSRFPDIRVQNKQARVVLPRGLNRRNPASRIRMRDEVTTIIPSETKALVRVAADATKKQLNDLK